MDVLLFQVPWRVPTDIFLTKTLPTIFKSTREMLLETNPDRKVMSPGALMNQHNLIVKGHIHRDLIEKARNTAFDDKNTLRVTEADGSEICYVNGSMFLVQCHKSNAITAAKVTSFNSVSKKATTFAQLTKRIMCMHVVRKVVADDGTVMYICDCVSFHHSGYTCSHVLVYMHLDKVINLFDLLHRLEPVKRKGRPTKRSKGLERMKGVTDVESAPPATWRNCVIRHEEYKSGVVSG
jgi:hypothetical protein